MLMKRFANAHKNVNELMLERIDRRENWLTRFFEGDQLG